MQAPPRFSSEPETYASTSIVHAPEIVIQVCFSVSVSDFVIHARSWLVDAIRCALLHALPLPKTLMTFIRAVGAGTALASAAALACCTAFCHESLSERRCDAA
eukprot:6209027-Pleurochrysis_carterae.AAC.2